MQQKRPIHGKRRATRRHSAPGVDVPEKGATKARTGGLQISEARQFQERFWRVERIAWILFAITLVVAVLGLTGAGGPLSRRTAALPLAQVDYPVVTRRQAADSITIRLAEGAERRAVTLSPDFAKSFQIEAIQPEPAEATTGPKGHTFEFSTDSGGWSDVLMFIRPQSAALASFSVQIDGGATSELQTLILP